MVGVRMNKEINTIIANLDGCIGMFDYLLTPRESKLLVSYIEELQQENQKYKKVIDKVRKEINEEHSIMGVEVVENWVLKDILKEVE